MILRGLMTLALGALILPAQPIKNKAAYNDGRESCLVQVAQDGIAACPDVARRLLEVKQEIADDLANRSRDKSVYFKW